MSLRTQLFLVSLLTLTLPWASCEYVRELEEVQRAVQKNSLQSKAETIAHTIPGDLYLDPFLKLRESSPQDSYAFDLRSPPQLDGYNNDWGLSDQHLRVFSPISGKSDLQVASVIGRAANDYFLFLAVTDNKVRYRSNSTEIGDEVYLSILTPDYTHNTYIVSTSAPGTVSVTVSGESPGGKRLFGYWQETSRGYNVELRIPAKDVGFRFGFLVRDVDEGDQTFYLGNLAPSGTAIGIDTKELPPFLRFRSTRLQEALTPFVEDNLRIRVIDPGGWEIADLGEPRWTTSNPRGFQDAIYRRVLNPDATLSNTESVPGRMNAHYVERALVGTATSAWQNTGRAFSATVAAAVPISSETETSAVLVLEQGAPDVLLLSRADSVSFLNQSILMTLSVGFVLLAYASYLSLRIRRLRDATDRAVSEDGHLQAEFVPSETADELGDLSRTFSTLLGRVREYTGYLEGLAGRLSHELRTPLTIVRSSLDNLNSAPLDGQSKEFANRAKEGVDRLSSILSAMTEASRLEQSIKDHELQSFNLSELLKHNLEAFRQVYPDHNFSDLISNEEHTIVGSPELLSQLMDKLINNAVDFCGPEKKIGIESQSMGNGFEVRVWNIGEPLPNTMTGKLFDSMVSVRAKHSRRGHLGLGLHIAKMIAEFHGGSIRAENLPDDNGAKFSVVLRGVKASSKSS